MVLNANRSSSGVVRKVGNVCWGRWCTIGQKRSWQYSRQPLLRAWQCGAIQFVEGSSHHDARTGQQTQISQVPEHILESHFAAPLCGRTQQGA